jgi:hypothetical protein
MEGASFVLVELGHHSESIRDWRLFNQVTEGLHGLCIGVE